LLRRSIKIHLYDELMCFDLIIFGEVFNGG
jgi:hypothetical protein